MADNVPVVYDEIAVISKDNLFRGFLGRAIRNPDRVLRTAGSRDGLDLYVRDEEDPHLFSTLQTRYLAVVGREWSIAPASEAAQDVALAEWLTATLLAANFDACRLNLLRAIHRGYAVVEVLYGLNDAGEVVPVRFIARAQRRFVFSEDGTLRFLSRSSPLDGEEVPPQKFLVHTHDDEEGTRYGSALGKRTHWYVHFKHNAIKFWMIFSEKFGTPTIVGKYRPGEDQAQKDLLFDAIESMQQDTGVTIPETMQLELLEAQRAGSMQNYEGLVTWLDAQISKAVLGQTLTTEQGSTGSLALGNVQNEVRLEIAKADADALSESINEQLIPWLVGWNFLNIRVLPRYYTVFEDSENLDKQSLIDGRLSRLGLPLTHKYLYERYNIPPGEPGEPVAVPLASGTDDGAAFAGAPAVRRVVMQMAPQRRAAAEMAQQASTSDTLTMLFVNEVSQDITTQLQGWIAGFSSFNSFSPQTFANAFDPTILADDLRQGMLITQLLGQAQVAADDAPARFAAVDPFSLSFDEAIAYFLTKIPLLPEAYKALEDQAKSQAFSLATAQTIQVVSLIQSALDQALRDGSTFEDFFDRAVNIFTTEGDTAPGRAHMENVFRTNLQTAYQVGRHAQLLQAVPFRPYWQYNAVDDTRTRPSHAAQNGKVYRYDHPFWQRWYPPNGYQCRCSVVSVAESELQEFGLTVTRRDTPLAPDEGFGVNPAL